MLAIASDRAAAAPWTGKYRYNLATRLERRAEGVIVRAGPDPEVDRVVRWRLCQRALRVMHERTVGKRLPNLGSGGFLSFKLRAAGGGFEPAANHTMARIGRERRVSRNIFGLLDHAPLRWIRRRLNTSRGVPGAHAVIGLTGRLSPLRAGTQPASGLPDLS